MAADNFNSTGIPIELSVLRLPGGLGAGEDALPFDILLSHELNLAMTADMGAGVITMIII
jgi:hypothetical protein